MARGCSIAVPPKAAAVIVAAAWLGIGASAASTDVIDLIRADPQMYARPANSEDVGDGFTHHGIPVNVPYRRGMVSTHNGEGQSVVLVWLRGDAILEINVETGEYRQHEPPMSSGSSPFASLLSSQNRYYTSFGGRFLEFDPEVGEFTFSGTRSGRHASSMIEDDEGNIWAAHSRSVELLRFNPHTRELHDYGSIYEPSGRRVSPRHLASDDQGWIYVALGGPTQIIMFHPETAEATTVLDEEQRGDASTRLWRHDDGRVYNPNVGGQWMQLYGGEARPIEGEPEAQKVYGTYKARMDGPFVSGTQGLQHRDLPNGERVEELDLDHQRLVLTDPDGSEPRELRFEVEGGAGVRSLLGRPLVIEPGLIVDGTAYPQRFYAYDPRTDEYTVGPRYGQWNVTTVTDDGIVYAGIYTAGALLEWDPARPWVETDPNNSDSNPRYLGESRGHPHLWRPTDILVYPGQRYIVHAAWSTESHPGGGLVFWDRETQTAEMLTHEDLIRYHNSISVAPLPNDRLLVGTSPHQWGGTVRADGDAKLYILDMETKAIEWQAELIEGAERYREMVVEPDGRVLVLVDRSRLIVFDPQTRTVVEEVAVPESFGAFAGGGRVGAFAETDDGRLFLLFEDVIAELDRSSYELRKMAETPGRARRSGAYLDGRIYLTVDLTHLYSWQVPTE